jgi:dipeptidase, putative
MCIIYLIMKTDIEAALKALKDLIRIDSVETEATPGNPFGEGNSKALAYALSLMSSFGFKTKNVDNFCGWGEIGSGELFGVLAHLDVVPEGTGWSHPPYSAETENGYLYGRGALDDKGPAVAAIFALASLAAEGKTPKKRVRIILGLDEESGWKCMDRYRETEELPVSGFSPDADFPVINCEKGIVYHKLVAEIPAGLYYIKAGTRPNVVPAEAEAALEYDKDVEKAALKKGLKIKKEGDKLTVYSTGKSCHASAPWEGESALVPLLEVLGKKYALCKTLSAAFSNYDGSGVGLKMADAESGALTLNLGVAETENGELIFSLDIRHPITYKKDDLTGILKKNLTGIEVRQDFFHLPLYVAPDNPLVLKLLEAYDSVTGGKSAPITIGGGTYARVLPLGVAFGPLFPGEASTIHQADERISIENFEKTIRIYKKALELLCF